jgi:hypothetical protein
MSVEHLGTYPVSKISYWRKYAYKSFIFMSTHLSNHPLICSTIQPSIQPTAHSFIHSTILQQ